MESIHYTKDADNIVTLTIDMPGQSANTMSRGYCEAMAARIQQLKDEVADASVKGVIIASAKDSFFAGGDLNELMNAKREDAEEIYAYGIKIKQDLRDLETLGIPVVAAINGAALGGGFEICLACHHRIAINDTSYKVGLPESQLGLLPGGGGVIRMVRLLGIQDALPFLLEAKQLVPVKAQEKGLIHALANDRDDLLAKARQWILDNPQSAQPWDQDGYKIPGGTPDGGPIAQMLPIIPAILNQNTFGCYPAQSAILATAVEGSQVDFDAAIRIETRYFVELVTGQVAKNMMGTFWFQLNDLKAGETIPGYREQPIKRLAIISPDANTAGLAYLSAKAGIEVVLLDKDSDNIAQQLAAIDALIAPLLEKGRMTDAEKNALLDNIKTAPEVTAADVCDLTLLGCGGDTTSSDTGPVVSLDANNTAQHSSASNFLCLDVAQPSDKAPLVEMLPMAATEDTATAKVFSWLRQIDKTPTVASFKQGPLVPKLKRAYMLEGLRMLASGISPFSIENAAKVAGMPEGPLAMADGYGPQELINDAEKDGWAIEDNVKALLDKSPSFYETHADGSRQIAAVFKPAVTSEAGIDIQTLVDRLLSIQAITALEALETGGIASVRDANIASIFGYGFAAWTGGVIQYVHHLGSDSFLDQVDNLWHHYGEAFNVPEFVRPTLETAATID